jgi:hypothetical protein
MPFTKETILVGHTDEATAYVVDDYPYGFRLRTKIRYWIETTKHGDRFVSQTLNPKVAHEHWNKPKKSTYSLVGCMFLDEEGHVTWTGLSNYSDEEAILAFSETVEGHLTEAQRAQLARLVAIRHTMRDVTYTVRERGTDEEEVAADAEQAKISAFLNRRLVNATPQAQAVVDLAHS